MIRKLILISRDQVPKMERTYIYFDNEGYFYVGDYFEYTQNEPMEVEIDTNTGKDYYFIKPVEAEKRQHLDTVTHGE